MNVYDFDGTIYEGDCSVDFFAFCLKKRPWLIFLLPWQILGICLYMIHGSSKEIMKERYFSFLKFIPHDGSYIDSFWDENIHRIHRWYKKQQQETDVVISASPAFLVKPACERIGIKNVIATDVEYATGKFLSKNCHDVMKVSFFKEKFPVGRVNQFYSDSLSDEPMARLADQAFLIDKGGIKPWPLKNHK